MALKVDESWIQAARQCRRDWTHHPPGGCDHEVQARGEQPTG
jgi:hypothetical protein